MLDSRLITDIVYIVSLGTDRTTRVSILLDIISRTQTSAFDTAYMIYIIVKDYSNLALSK